MSLNRVGITDFRCLAKVDLQTHTDTNLIVGPNASGKTSLLEAVYFLGRGRSFRAVRSRGLIRDGCPGFTLTAHLDGLPKRLGVKADAEGLAIRVDGQSAKGLAHLAAAVPVQVIEPGIHRLIEAGPAERRAFLDWGVFHVKHSFLQEWRRYQRALKQRNAAIRSQGDRAAARAWEDALIAAGVTVHALREDYVGELLTWFGEVGRALLGQEVQLRYSPGWPREQDLATAVEHSWERDRRFGLTHVGPHRADLQVSLAQRAARSRVSRGQQKLLAAALVLAQMHLFHFHREQRAVLLVDDAAAELDSDALERLFQCLQEAPAQRFITGLNVAQMPTALPHAMFHVEQGKLQKMV